jgi:2-isopropylmalate synthase
MVIDGNALDLALRKDLSKYQIYIRGSISPTIACASPTLAPRPVTRMPIESEDENGEHWTTIGVSPNIIDASFQALMDSIVYKLVKSGAPA